MSGYTDHHILKYPTSECTDKCTGLCGYCPEHEKARPDKNRDWLIGPEPCRWDRGEGSSLLYICPLPLADIPELLATKIISNTGAVQ